MNAARNSYLFILSFLLLCGCDPELNHERVIENTSGYDIWAINESVSPPDSILILDGSEQVIWSFWGIGTVSDFEDCHPDQVDIFHLSGKDLPTLEILKDPNNLVVWEHIIRVQGVFGSGSTECRMGIGPEDVR